ncbi:DUF6292 family protein [Amycolatopsis sp. NPDC051102]|uniref:DUF6292 family protein n=1 Tax=Amycolatopsis sp. NPDC051102 TaxID=3155163 RepID=UPI00341DC761
MKPDPGHVEVTALRDYVETVAELLRVEPAASWSEPGSPATAYIALAARHAGRFLMLQWAADSGWCLAVEPDGGEAPSVLVRWPEPARPRPAVVARRVHEALTEAASHAKGSTHEPDSR